ncbi:MAG: MFS transporter [Anaerolineae bacterium]|nr:MFS transporter [Thermoflexales bacterium]MDW8408615.1 MFS transporter [Anaerolineae bacterium]
MANRITHVAEETVAENTHRETYPEAGARGKRPIAFIFATVFLDLLGIGILIPVIPYLVQRYSNDALAVALLSLSYAAAQFVAAPVLGALSDRYGRRPLLVLSVLGSAIGYVLFGLAGSLAMLFVARMIDGFTGGNISIAQAYIADVTPPKDRAKNFGLIGAAFGLGFIMGPALGGLLSQISLHAPAFAAAFLSFVTAAFGFFFLPESLPPHQRKRAVITLAEINPVRQIGDTVQRAGMRPVLLAIFAQNFAFAGLQSNFGVFTFQRFGLGPQENAALFTFLGVIGVFMQGFLVRRLVNRFSDQRLAVAGLVIMMAGFAATAFAPAVWALYPTMALVSIGNALATPTLTNLVSKQAGAREQGAVLGATQSVGSLTRIGGPMWAGVTFDTLGPGAPYWTGALWIALAAVVALRHAHRRAAQTAPVGSVLPGMSTEVGGGLPAR